MNLTKVWVVKIFANFEDYNSKDEIVDFEIFFNKDSAEEFANKVKSSPATYYPDLAEFFANVEIEEKDVHV